MATFDELKNALTKAPLLALPKFCLPFIMDTYVSGSEIGAIFLQNNRSISYFSKKLQLHLTKAYSCVRE